MNLPELFKARGHEYYDRFHVIVKREEFDYVILKDGLTRQINQAPNQSAYQKAIADEYDLFFNKGVPQEAFSRLSSVSELVRLGFNLHRGNPFLTVDQIINRPDFKKGLIQLKSGVHYVRWLGEVEERYKGERIDQLKDIDEVVFEAFHYLVVGGNFERVLFFLEDYKANTKHQIEQAGLSNDTNSKTYFLLKAYFEKGCKDLVDYDIQKISEKTGLAARALVNKNKDLKKINYGLNHTGNHNQIKSLYSTYQKLLNEFEGVNETAFNEVQTRLNRITKTYGDLLSQN